MKQNNNMTIRYKDKISLTDENCQRDGYLIKNLYWKWTQFIAYLNWGCHSKISHTGILSSKCWLLTVLWLEKPTGQGGDRSSVWWRSLSCFIDSYFLLLTYPLMAEEGRSGLLLMKSPILWKGSTLRSSSKPNYLISLPNWLHLPILSH